MPSGIPGPLVASYNLIKIYKNNYNYTVNSLNCGHFGAQASVLYIESVLYSSVRVISSPICAVITVIMLFIKASTDIV